MKNINSLKNKDFSKVYNQGKSFANKYLIMYVLKVENYDKRLGISVSKKVGNSIIRHRVTRLIREAYRLNEKNLCNNIDIVIIGRPNAKGKGYREIESAILHLAKMHNIIA